jgi:hypothetical protein
MTILVHGALAMLAIVASGCRISSGLGVSRPSVTAQAGASGQAGATDRRAGASDTAPSQKLGIHHHEMVSIVGLTVEQARKRLREFCHVGEVIIEEIYVFDPGCQLGTVCGTNSPGGASCEAEIRLRVNRSKLAIPEPPP